MSTVGAGQTYHLHGVLASGTTLTADAGTSGGPAATILVQGGAVNDGTINLLANSYYGDFGGVGATLDITGRLASNGVISVGGGGAGSHYGGGPVTGSLLVNAGVFVNTGALTVNAGYYGPQEGQPGLAATLIDSGRMTNSGTMTLAGGSYGAGYGIAPGAQAQVSGVLQNTGLIAIDLYQFTIGGHTYTAPGDGATLAVSGVMTNAGSVSIAGSYGVGHYYQELTPALKISGALLNRGEISVAAGTAGGAGGTLVDQGLVTNTGTIALAAGTGISAGSLGVGFNGTLVDAGSVGGGGTLFNDGVISASGINGSIATALVNDGAVRVHAGQSLSIAGAITASPGAPGQFYIGPNSTLSLGATVGTSEQVNFAGSGGTLALSEAGGFAGVLSGLAGGDTMDFLNASVSGAAISGEVLRIGVGFHVYTFQLAQPLAAGVGYAVSSDGHGGTNLVFTGRTTAPHL